jgi:nucleoid-associated protein YgaU
MPKKKTVKKDKGNLDIQKLMQSSDSYKSLIYGIVTVVVLFIVIALGVRTLSQNQADIDDKAAMTEGTDDVLTNEYVVGEGETLWSIAEKSYKDGYSWKAIADANNLTEPYELEEGQKLVIPKLTPTESAADASIAMEQETEEVEEDVLISAPSPTAPEPTKAIEAVAKENKISGNSYKIVEGDNLWNIAVRAYGDGYRWVEIAKNNKIANPDLIYPDDTLELSRP